VISWLNQTSKLAFPFASGYFGSVYRVRVVRSNERCVLKTVKDASMAGLMLDEVRLINKLSSEFIVRYIGVCTRSKDEAVMMMVAYCLNQSGPKH